MSATHPPAPAQCSYHKMFGGSRCGRPIHPAPRGADSVPVCLMHSSDPDKDRAAFQAKIWAILNSTSEPVHDFSGFVFPVADFGEATFTKVAVFYLATFTEDANFRRATFTQDAYFGGATFTQSANFGEATFTKGANFTGATFTKGANFTGATFTRSAAFYGTTFARAAYFRGARFEHPAEIVFHAVNRALAPGLKLGLRDCLTDGVRFVDVNWYTEKGRLVLQDELDLGNRKGDTTHEAVAQSYRSLVNNFEKARQYELAEQCVVSEMDMRRLNPSNFLWAKPLAGLYQNSAWARSLGAHLSLTYLYRWFTLYGSSYKRALVWLLLWVLAVFPALYGLSGMRLVASENQPGSRAPAPVISWHQAWANGGRNRSRPIEFLYASVNALTLSVETAMFQRRPLLEPAGRSGHIVAALETVAVPGQLALLLLALRRRFRR